MRLWAEIDSKALAHNYARLKHFAPHSKVVAMVKTNAYGHGLLDCAKVLQHSDYLGLATIDEAILLRNNGIQTPLILMPGIQSQEELEQIQEYRVDSIIYDPFQLDLLKQAKQNIAVWLKFETGMHRLGFAPEFAQEAIAIAESLPNIKIQALMTHFANADSPDPHMVMEQMQAFNKTVEGHNYPLSVSNSSAILRYPDLAYDYIRPGMMLYGVSPLLNGLGSEHGLIPVMTLKARIIRIMTVNPGETVGYGCEWKADRVSKIAVVSCGYGDGYPRKPNASMVLINGHKAPTAGRSSMDYITVDITDVPNVKVGDAVTLWGKDLPIEPLTEMMGVSYYAMLSNLSARIKRIVV
jgi:alanine racemase